MDNNYKKYKRKGTMLLRPYQSGEDLSDVSVSEEDKPPKEGDMIAKNPDNPDDKWLVNKEYFESNYVEFQNNDNPDINQEKVIKKGPNMIKEAEPLLKKLINKIKKLFQS